MHRPRNACRSFSTRRESLEWWLTDWLHDTIEVCLCTKCPGDGWTSIRTEWSKVLSRGNKELGDTCCRLRNVRHPLLFLTPGNFQPEPLGSLCNRRRSSITDLGRNIILCSIMFYCFFERWRTRIVVRVRLSPNQSASEEVGQRQNILTGHLFHGGRSLLSEHRYGSLCVFWPWPCPCYFSCAWVSYPLLVTLFHSLQYVMRSIVIVWWAFSHERVRF